MHVGKSLATLDTRYLKLKKMWNRTVSGCISGRSEMIFFHSLFLKILRGLDRESTPSYELRVKAEDQGTPRRSSTALYTVTVDDANDNSPQFAADQVKTLSVREDQTAGEVLLTLTASDADTGMYHATSYVSHYVTSYVTIT